MCNVPFTKYAAEYARDSLERITASMPAKQREATRELAKVVHLFITAAEAAAP